MSRGIFNQAIHKQSFSTTEDTAKHFRELDLLLSFLIDDTFHKKLRIA